MIAERDDKGRFRRGVEGNPNGRPAVTKFLSEELATLDTVTGSEPTTKAQRIAELAVRMALRGDMRAIEFCADRTEGRPRIAAIIEHGEDSHKLAFARAALQDSGLRQHLYAANRHAAQTDGFSERKEHRWLKSEFLSTPWQAVTSGDFSIKEGHRCLQYRVVLKSDNGDRYPVVDRVAIELARK